MCSTVSFALIIFISIICCSIGSSSAASSRKQQQLLQNKRLKSFDYETVKYEQIFPRRVGEEAAVVEWGHSAIISAIDAVVAKFGPQPSMGASFEVEAAPVLADPMDGGSSGELNNADQVHGNMCVMTNSAGLSGVAMAKIAKDSGAVALMVVNVLEIDNPDYIYSMSCESEKECEWAELNIDIPVIMISLSSGNVLTTASSTTTSNDSSSNNDNLSMPDRVRLYAGGDRPFFEDVQHEQPVVYLIHNLLTPAECDALIRQSAPLLEPVLEEPNSLEGVTDAGSSSFGIERAFLWRGLLKSHDQKAIDERIEQVTGFPQNHISDFQVNKFTSGSYHAPHYDALPGGGLNPHLASIHFFLSDDISGGEFVFPLSKKPIKIIPKKGLAVVFHNTLEDGQVDSLSAHGELAITNDGTKWTARKWIYQQPVSKARRVVVPLIAYPFGGKAPTWMKELHNTLVQKFGADIGSTYFDQILMAIPVVILLCIAALVRRLVFGSSTSGKAVPLKEVSKHKQSGKKNKKE